MNVFVKTTHYCIGAIDCLNEWIGRSVAWLTFAMVLVSFTIVVLRYGFNAGWIAMQDSVKFMHALVFMLGAAYTLRHDEHVRVDILYQRMSDKARAWIDVLGTLFLLFPVSAFTLWSSWDYVGDAWAIRESSRDSGGLEGVYLLKTSIPIMAALLIVQGTAQCLRNLMILAGHPPSGALEEN